MGHYYVQFLTIVMRIIKSSPRRKPGSSRWMFWIPAFAGMTFFTMPVWAAPAKAPAKDAAHAPAPSGIDAAKNAKQGELEDITIKGLRKDKMAIGKFDPPAAFNLEDIQNFPEDRLQPVLNNPIYFEEGRDFSSMMDFQEDRLIHPWLAELSRGPFLTMKTAVEKASRDWTFSVIDQAGATVAKQEGKGNPPANLIWSGEDKFRDHAAVDTVYIPQLATTDKDGYRHTYMGQPVQFSSLVVKLSGKTVIELSSKRLFLDKKAEWTKEAFTLLDKVCDLIREEARLPFAIQPYDTDLDLARSRQEALMKYFSEKLYVPQSQMVASNPSGAEKRGAAMTIILSAIPGGSN